jgi:hypothetical protein
VEPEDVVHVLGNMVKAVRPGGIVLDLQVIRPDPRVEVDGRLICATNGLPLFTKADAAAAAVDNLVGARRLREETFDDHDVLKHYPDGADLLEDLAGGERRPAEEDVPRLRAIARPCVIRERCRLRRLTVVG